MFTVSPQMSKLNFCRPTTPATTGPIWMPTRTSHGIGSRRAESMVAAAHSMLAITGSGLGRSRPAVASSPSPTVLIFSRPYCAAMSSKAEAKHVEIGHDLLRREQIAELREADHIREQHDDILVPTGVTSACSRVRPPPAREEWHGEALQHGASAVRSRRCSSAPDRAASSFRGRRRSGPSAAPD